MKALFTVILVTVSTMSFAISDLKCDFEVPGDSELMTVKFDLFHTEDDILAYVQYDSEFFKNALVPGCVAATVTDLRTSLVFSCVNTDGEFSGSAAEINKDGTGAFKFFKKGPLGIEGGGLVDLINCEETDFKSQRPLE